LPCFLSCYPCFDFFIFEAASEPGGISLVKIEALCAAPPEAPAHSASLMPLTCPVAPSFQRELHKDGVGGGGVARRARAALAPKARSCATSCGTSSAAPYTALCAAFFTCSSHVPVFHVSPEGRRGGRHECAWLGFEGRLCRGRDLVRGRARVRFAARRSMTLFVT